MLDALRPANSEHRTVTEAHMCTCMCKDWRARVLGGSKGREELPQYFSFLGISALDGLEGAVKSHASCPCDRAERNCKSLK